MAVSCFFAILTSIQEAALNTTSADQTTFSRSAAERVVKAVDEASCLPKQPLESSEVQTSANAACMVW